MYANFYEYITAQGAEKLHPFDPLSVQLKYQATEEEIRYIYRITGSVTM